MNIDEIKMNIEIKSINIGLFLIDKIIREMS